MQIEAWAIAIGASATQFNLQLPLQRIRAPSTHVVCSLHTTRLVFFLSLKAYQKRNFLNLFVTHVSTKLKTASMLANWAHAKHRGVRHKHSIQKTIVN